MTVKIMLLFIFGVICILIGLISFVSDIKLTRYYSKKEFAKALFLRISVFIFGIISLIYAFGELT